MTAKKPAGTPQPLKTPPAIRQTALDRFGPPVDLDAVVGIPIPDAPVFHEWKVPAFVGPRGKKQAFDEASREALRFLNNGGFSFRTSFLGYPFLAELCQIAEFRNASEVPAGQMTKKWVKWSSASGQDQNERIKGIEKWMRKHRVRQKFHEAAIYDGNFGGCRVFIDVGAKDDKTLKLPLVDTPETIGKGTFRSLRVIDPVITSPSTYNAVDPLADDYYVPQTWFLLGREVHHTRLLPFVSKPLPYYLRPVYNFGGMSTSQLAFDTIRNWREVRDSTTKLIKSYSINGIYTDLQTILNGGNGDKEKKRTDLFIRNRDNQGILLLDKGREEYFQHNVPLGSIDKLQAQAQEHPAAVCRIPLIFLLGITPTGLNASSEGEIRAFYDYISELQDVLFRDNLERLTAIAQLDLYGDIDPDIVFEFNPLWQMDDKALAAIRKDDAMAADLYFNMGAVTGEQVANRLAKDPHSGWDGLEVADIPEDPESLLDDPEDGGAASPGAPKPLPGLTAEPGAPAKGAGPKPEPGAKALLNGLKR